MQRCPELRKLSKAPRITSVYYRRQTPGSINSLFHVNQGSNPERRLDPKHPIDLVPGKPKIFLWAKVNPAFTLGAIHQGLLLPAIKNPNQVTARLASAPLDCWNDRLERGKSTGNVAPVILGNDPYPRRLPMSIQFEGSRDLRTHQRVQVHRRFKIAVDLIATRGAVGKEVKGRLRLAFDENDTKDWILHGWTYFVRPTLALYRIPYPELVNLLRTALRELFTRGTQMEEEWTARSLHSKDFKSKIGTPAKSTNLSRGVKSAFKANSTPTLQSHESVPALPSIPTFDPFPDTPAPVASSPAPVASSPAPVASSSAPIASTPAVPPANRVRTAPEPRRPAPRTQRKASNPDPNDWWAIGSKIEAAVGETIDVKGSTRRDRPPHAAQFREQGAGTKPAQREESDSAQTRLSRMLFQQDKVTVARAGGIGERRDAGKARGAWQAHQLEEK
ncbi:hypothetical protein B0H16DRAFT_319000 [Mycena metata]|uniref:Uncharacterized protein n=1 Tax=Mycena metata TaxID=1033252 RepID=A0AAD7JRF8_9AGAR|nr:hypothetical protein B0H16DRAFT_319000 [Mycena metata]